MKVRDDDRAVTGHVRGVAHRVARSVCFEDAIRRDGALLSGVTVALVDRTAIDKALLPQESPCSST